MHRDIHRLSLLVSASMIGGCGGPAYAADAPAEGGGTIVVTAQRLDKNARAEQAIAPNLVNIQAAETIAKYPDINAAEALGRISGVAISIDTGEGRYVNIRGLDGNLNGSTFGGTTLLNTQPGLTYFNSTGRAVEFDTIPIGAIDRIVVTKTGLPDHDAEGLGGTIELTPRTAIGRDKFFFEGTLGEGYEPERKTTILNEEIAVGGGFGVNSSGDTLFHVVLTQYQHNDARGFDDIEEGYADSPGIVGANVATENKVFSSLELRRYRYHRQRSSYSAEFDVTPNSSNRIFARFNLTGYNEQVNRQRLIFNGLDGSGNGGAVSVDPKNSNGFAVTGASARNTLRDDRNSARNLIAQVGGEHHFGNIKFDWAASYVRATFSNPVDINSTFSGPGEGNNPNQAGFVATYDNITNPNFPIVKAVGVNLADPSLFTLNKLTNRTEYDRDQAYGYLANLSVPVGLVADDEFKVGGKISLRTKSSRANSSSFTASGQPLTGFLGDGPFTTYYHGRYNIGYSANAEALATAFGSNLAIAPLGVGDTIFDDVEDIYSGYAQYSARLGKLNMLAGVRIEHTKSRLGGLLTSTSGTGVTTTAFTTIPTNYTNVFPTLQFRYDFSAHLIGRATYSTGIARPGFNQTILNGAIDSSGGPNGTVGVVTGGNPALKPTTGNNFDVSVEYYLPNSGIISIGLFDKEFRDFIVQNNFIAPFSANGVTGNYTFQSFQNVSGAYARGIEVAFVDKFTGLAAPFDALGVDLNASYVDSSVAIHHVVGLPAIFGPLPGTFEYTGNGALFYEKGPINLRLSVQYESKVLFAVGSIAGSTGYAGISNDAYQDKRVTLDFTGSYDLTRNVKLYWSAKNLTDAPLRFYEGTSNRPIQREFYGATYEGGVKVKF